VDRLIALLWLRWKLELRALARARETAVGLIFMIPGFLLFAAMGGAAAFFGLRRLEAVRPEWVLPLISAAATMIGLFWALSPLLAGLALSETHDVTRLMHFPVRARTLVVSSFISNLLQPSMLVVVPVAAAAALGMMTRVSTLPLALAGVFLTVIFMLAAAQTAGLVLQALGRNRRWHDIALFFGIGFGFLMSLGPALLLTAGGRHLAGWARRLTEHDVFALSPFAWGVRAAVHGARGQLTGFALLATLSLLASAAMVAASSVLVARIYRSEVVSGTAVARGRARVWLPGALGALIEKDLRMGWRDPAIRAAFFIGLAGPLVFLFFLSRARGGWSGAPLLLLAMFVGLSPFGANAFGLERRGIGLLMSFPLPRWKILVGKNLGALLLRAPSIAMILIAGAFLAPNRYLPAALALVVLTLLISAGMDNFLSVMFPTPVPAPGANPYAAVSGNRGLGHALVSAALLFVVATLCAPFILLAWLPVLLDRLNLWLVTLPLALVGAFGVYAMLVILAERLLVRREPELLERILGEA
jgi:ABC-2 type transport system permease protein